MPEKWVPRNIGELLGLYVGRPLAQFDSTFLAQKPILPELWIGKVLYCPINVVLSSANSASAMYNTTVWNLCSGWSV